MINSAVFYNSDKNGVAFIQNEGNFLFDIAAKESDTKIKQLMNVLFQDHVRMTSNAPTTAFYKKGNSIIFVRLKNDPSTMGMNRTFYRTTVAEERVQLLSTLGNKILHKMKQNVSGHELNAYFSNEIAPSDALPFIDQVKKSGVYVFSKNIADAMDLRSISLVDKVMYYSVDGQLFRKKLGVSEAPRIVNSKRKVLSDMLKSKIISRADVANALIKKYTLSDLLASYRHKTTSHLSLGRRDTDLLFIRSLLSKDKTDTWFIREDSAQPNEKRFKGVFFNNGTISYTSFKFNEHIRRATEKLFEFLSNKNSDDHINNFQNVPPESKRAEGKKAHSKKAESKKTHNNKAHSEKVHNKKLDDHASNLSNLAKAAINKLPEELKKAMLEEKQKLLDHKADLASFDQILKKWLLLVHPDRLTGKTAEDIQKIFKEKTAIEISSATAALILNGEVSKVCNEIRKEIENVKAK